MKLWKCNIFSCICPYVPPHIGPHCTARQALAPCTCANLSKLDLTVQSPPAPRACLNKFIMKHKHVKVTSGWFASYWKTFLLLSCYDLSVAHHTGHLQALIVQDVFYINSAPIFVMLTKLPTLSSALLKMTIAMESPSALTEPTRRGVIR